MLAADLDEDGLIDIYVANDLTANLFYKNLGGFRFREIGAEAGLATNAEGGYLAGMGIACGDLDGDGRLDLAVTNFYGQMTTFYLKNLGATSSSTARSRSASGAPSRYLLGFGIAFLDAVNDDGRLDLATANGHVNDLRPHVPFAMPARLLLGGRGPFAQHRAQAGPPWAVPRIARGLASGDVDNDGKIDLLIVSAGEPLAYFHNQGPTGHSLTLKLEGTRSNRDAIGANVILTAGGRRQVAQRFGGGSFLSTSDPRLHFGLGQANRAQSLEMRLAFGTR